MDKIDIKKTSAIRLNRLKLPERKNEVSLISQRSEMKNDQNTPLRRIANLPEKRSFKRSNTTLKTQHTQNVEETIPSETRRKLHHYTMPATKFAQKDKKIMDDDEKFSRFIQEITPKSQCFYRFAFKSYQTPIHKRIFSDIMNLSKQKTKGMLFIGELWNNEMTKQFMKVNNISLTKRKLNEKLREMRYKKIKKEKELLLSNRSVKQLNQKSQYSIRSSHEQQLDFMPSLNRVISEFSDYETMDSDIRNTNLSQKLLKKDEFEKVSKTFRGSLDNLRNSIDEESKRCKNQEYWRKMKSLEKQTSNFHQIWGKYFQNLLQDD